MRKTLFFLLLFIPSLSHAGTGWAHSVCIPCHDVTPQYALGVLEHISTGEGFIQVGTGESDTVFLADRYTQLRNAKSPKVLEEKIGDPVSVYFDDAEGALPTAKEVVLKPVSPPPPENRIRGKDLLTLVKKGSGRGGYTLVDVRFRTDYRRRHIPSAINIEPGHLNDLAEQLPRTKSLPVIFYGESAHWPTAWSMAQQVKELGYEKVQVYVGGLSDWTLNGKQPLAIDPQYLADLISDERFPVILDLRDSSELKGGFIPGAVSMNPGSIEGNQRYFPSNPDAPVVVYDAGRISNSAVSAARMLSDWGYRNATVLEEGFKGWEEAGHPVQTGRPNIMIAYVPWEEPGQVSSLEFVEIVDSAAQDVVLLDVRHREELEAGTVTYAIGIPLRELPERLGEIPTGLRVVAFSSRPESSAIACGILRMKGYDATYLPSKFIMEAEGAYVVQ